MPKGSGGNKIVTSGTWKKGGLSPNPAGGAARGLHIGEVKQLARTHTVEAVELLVGFMRNETIPFQTRLLAANSLLDRGWGKPTPVIEAEDGEGLVVVIRKFAPELKTIEHDDSEIVG
jgi:hypothetical protein